MLDKNQSVVAQTTVLNSVSLAVGIASNIFGNTVINKDENANVTSEKITSLMVNKLKSKFMLQGNQNA